MDNAIVCELCECEEEELTKHHLIPKKLHRKNWVKKIYTTDQLHQTISLCKNCHQEIHRFIPHNDMGKTFNTLSSLLSHPQVSKYVKWRKKKLKIE